MISISAKHWRKAVQRTLFAAANSYANSSMRGILFHFAPEQVFCATATDGHRLSHFEIAHACPTQPTSFVLDRSDLERSSAVDFMRRAAQADSTLKISAVDNFVLVAWEKESFRFALSEKRFPNWESIMPPEHGCVTARCSKTALQKLLAQVRLETKSSDRRVTIWLRADRIVLAAYCAENPCGLQISAQCNQSAFGVFNADYVRDALKALPAGEIAIRFKKPSKDTAGILTAVEFCPVNPGKELVRQIVMPCYPAASSELPDLIQSVK